jgi:hypothetical protein
MATTKIDTLVMIIADQNGGKSNQIRTTFEDPELFHYYNGYPPQSNKKYYVHPDMDLYIRLSSWHEKNENYTDVKSDLTHGYSTLRHRYKVLVPAQVTSTSELLGGDDLFTRILNDFDVRRAYAVWLNPDRSNRRPFALSQAFAKFMSSRRYVSALAIDSLALHPSAAPKTNSINARLLSDLLFRT